MKKLFVIFTTVLTLNFFIPFTAFAASASIDHSATGSAGSLSFTVNNANSVMVASFVDSSGNAASGVTYNGVALTSQITRTNSNAVTSIWTLDNPDTGAHTFSWTGAGTVQVYEVINATVTGGATQSGVGTGNSNITITPNSSGGVFFSAVAQYTTAGCNNTSAGDGQTLDFNGSGATGIASLPFSSNSAQSLHYSFFNCSSTPNWAEIALEIETSASNFAFWQFFAF